MRQSFPYASTEDRENYLSDSPEGLEWPKETGDPSFPLPWHLLLPEDIDPLLDWEAKKEAKVCTVCGQLRSVCMARS